MLAHHGLGYTRIVEAPVRIRERFGSTISLKAVWLLMVDTIALFIRYSIRHDYDATLAARVWDRAIPPLRARAEPGGGRPGRRPSLRPSGARHERSYTRIQRAGF